MQYRKKIREKKDRKYTVAGDFTSWKIDIANQQNLRVGNNYFTKKNFFKNKNMKRPVNFQVIEFLTDQGLYKTTIITYKQYCCTFYDLEVHTQFI